MNDNAGYKNIFNRLVNTGQMSVEYNEFLRIWLSVEEAAGAQKVQVCKLVHGWFNSKERRCKWMHEMAQAAAVPAKQLRIFFNASLLKYVEQYKAMINQRSTILKQKAAYMHGTLCAVCQNQGG